VSRPGNGLGETSPVAAESRERILAAAFRVVARDTISGTRMPVIAKEAGLSQGSLHYYWDSKENLLMGLLDWLLDAFREGRGITSGETVPPVRGHDPVAGVARQVELVRLLVTKEQDMSRVYYDFWVQAAAKPGPLQEAFRYEVGRYRAAIRSTMLPPSSPPALVDPVAAVFLGLLEGPLLQLALQDDAFDHDRYLAVIERLMMHAITHLSDLGD
jgi:TetR/AcrR family transcriptional regulator